MKSIKEGCPALEELCDYVKGSLTQKMREEIESHLACCYHCLDIVVSIHDGATFYNKSCKKRKGFTMKKEFLFLIMAVLCFLASFVFSRFFLQFLTATIILGIKWIVDSKTNKMLILIYDAWKRGGEREAGRILKELESR